MKALVINIAIILGCFQVKSQSINISLFNSNKITSLTISFQEGKYFLKSEGNIISEYGEKSVIYIQKKGHSFEIVDKNNLVGTFKEIEFLTKDKDAVFTINSLSPSKPTRQYNGNIIIRCSKEKLLLINKIDMEKYIAGVIEAEGGLNSPLEYYKAQAVLIRTYTIKSMYKHAEEGFNLCDEVHCQAYKGRSYKNSQILEATTSTAGHVLIDQDSVLIMAPFHSTCGGITSPAGIVWLKDLPYLKPVKDPFCDKTKHSNWSKTITKEQWCHYLINEGYKKQKVYSANYTYHPNGRVKEFEINGININTRSVREHFRLKSAYFSLSDHGSKITINGKGYGHGVGMCQYGAMEMARVGYTWKDIVWFYFQNVKLVDFREIELHRY